MKQDTITIKIRPPVDPANPRYYLDKVAMHASLKAYKDACAAAEAESKERPMIPDYLGECFLGIAKGYAMKYNFRSYSFVNDMVGDAVMTCIRYVRSYDPDRRNDSGTATSPLAYFTQCCHYAFLGRIATEAKQSKLKRALILNANIDTFSLNGDDDAKDFHMHLNEFTASLGAGDVSPEEPRREKKTTVRVGLLDQFLE